MMSNFSTAERLPDPDDECRDDDRSAIHGSGTECNKATGRSEMKV
jgi:hypothetical protein